VPASIGALPHGIRRHAGAELDGRRGGRNIASGELDLRVGQTTPDLGGALDALERAIPDDRGAPGEATATPRLGATLAIYRSLVATITRLSPAPLVPATAS
jgi:hypothetical protein